MTHAVEQRGLGNAGTCLSTCCFLFLIESKKAKLKTGNPNYSVSKEVLFLRLCREMQSKMEQWLHLVLLVTSFLENENSSSKTLV